MRVVEASNDEGYCEKIHSKPNQDLMSSVLLNGVVLKVLSVVRIIQRLGCSRKRFEEALIEVEGDPETDDCTKHNLVN